jgi:hypothetical protein
MLARTLSWFIDSLEEESDLELRGSECGLGNYNILVIYLRVYELIREVGTVPFRVPLD